MVIYFTRNKFLKLNQTFFNSIYRVEIKIKYMNKIYKM